MGYGERSGEGLVVQEGHSSLGGVRLGGRGVEEMMVGKGEVGEGFGFRGKSKFLESENEGGGK